MLFAGGCAGHLPGGPIAVDCAGLAVCFENEQRGGDLVDEEAVVGDGDDRAGEVDQGAFHDLDAGEVEVVGGFVEDQDLGAGEEAAGEGDAGFLATGEGADALREGGFGEAHEFEEFVDLLAGGLECEAFFAADGVDGVGDGVGEIEMFEGVVEGDALGAAEPFDAAGVGGFVFGEDFEEGGFAAAIGADDDEALAAGEVEGDVLEEEVVFVGFGEAGEDAEAFGAAEVLVEAGDDGVDGFGFEGFFDVGEFALDVAGGIFGGIFAVGDGLGFEEQQFFFVLELVFEHFEAGLALADVIAETGDGVFVGVVVFDFDDAGDDFVEEMAVM